MAKAWGIDIGRGAIKGVLLRQTAGSMEILAADQEPLKVFPKAPTPAEVEESQRTALTAFLKRNPIRGERVFLSIPGHTAFNRLLRIPPVEPKKLAQSIRFEAQQQIPFPIEEVVWDYQELPRDAASGEDWEVNLFAVKKDFIAKTLHNLGLVGLEVDGLQVGPLALFNFMRYDRDLRGSNVLIDMGAESTDLILLDADKTFIRNIPIAGHQITSQLMEKFKIPFAEAEKLKLKSSGTKQAQKIFKIMKPSLGEMTAEITRSIGYYSSQVPDVKFREAFVVGNSSQLVGLQRFLTDNLELKVRVVERLEIIRLAPGAGGEVFDENFPGFPIALGLALQALGVADNNVNLLPAPIVEARAERRTRPWYAAAAVLLAITLLALFLSKSGFRGDYTAAIDEAGKVKERVASLSGSFGELQKNDDILSRYALRAGLSRDRTAALGVLNDVYTLLEVPEGEADKKRPTLWLLKVDIKPMAKPEGAADAPRALTVSVLAAMENPRPDVEDLGDVKEIAQTRVKEYVVKRIAKMDKRYANVRQEKEKLVADLNSAIHEGKRYYRFLVTWVVNLEGE